jgi:hypothetical protein
MTKAGQKIIDGLKDAIAGNFSRVHIPDGTGKLQTWYRVDAEGRALLTGNVNDHCPGCGARLGDLPDDPKVISLDQYEALMAAAKDWLSLCGDVPHRMCDCAVCKRRNSINAALRAAGIDTEGKT